MDRGAWRTTVHEVAESQTQPKQLSTHAHAPFPRSGADCVEVKWRGEGDESRVLSPLLPLFGQAGEWDSGLQVEIEYDVSPLYLCPKFSTRNEETGPAVQQKQ